MSFTLNDTVAAHSNGALGWKPLFFIPLVSTGTVWVQWFTLDEVVFPKPFRSCCFLSTWFPEPALPALIFSSHPPALSLVALPVCPYVLYIMWLIVRACVKSAGVCWSASLGMDKIERGLPTSSAAASLTGNATWLRAQWTKVWLSTWCLLHALCVTGSLPHVARSDRKSPVTGLSLPHRLSSQGGGTLDRSSSQPQ